MTIETMACPRCGHACGFEPSSGEVWCPTDGGGCGYQYSPEQEQLCSDCGQPFEQTSPYVKRCTPCIFKRL